MVDGEGLVVRDAAGTRRTIAFGSPVSVAVEAASLVYGKPKTFETLEECGAGPLQVRAFNGLTLSAQDDKFVGWWLKDSEAARLPTTPRAGIGLGSTRGRRKGLSGRQYQADSSLGDEFVADGFAGSTDGDGKAAKVTHLWAGAPASCAKRASCSALGVRRVAGELVGPLILRMAGMALHPVPFDLVRAAASSSSCHSSAFLTGLRSAVRQPLRRQPWIHLVMPSRT